MAIYDINGKGLSAIYDIIGNALERAYDANGNEIYSRRSLTGISVIYSGGIVPAGTTLDQLTGITVTATYSDGTTETVTDYTLSGTLTAGQDNTITVTYQSKTATFTVTVAAVVTHNATRTYSAGDVAVTVDDDADEQIVSVEAGTMAYIIYPDFPAFENPYLECPESKFPIKISAGGNFRDQLLDGYLNFTSGVKYFCAAHCVTDGTVLKGAASTYVQVNSLNGTGWFYWIQTGSPFYSPTFECSKKTVVDKLYAFPLSGDYESLSDYGAGIAKYLGELDLIPGRNFPGRTTNGVVTVYKNGTAIGTNKNLTSLSVSPGDVLSCNGGALVFRVGVNTANPLTEINYVAFGDSLTDATINADYKYHAIIKDGIGLPSVPSYGKGSTGYKQGYDSGLSYWQRISAIPHDADIVTIFGSVNDWKNSGNSSGDQTGNVTDNLSTGQRTLAAYMNATLDIVAKRAPLAKVALVTELYYEGPGYADYRIAKLKAIGAAHGMSVYDLYNDTYEGKGLADGTNPYANTIPGLGLNFKQITDAAFGREYTTDYSAGGHYGHPSNSYHLQWLAPKFADIICKELGLSASLLPDNLRIDA